MKTTIKAAKNVKIGDVVLQYGYRYVVTENVFDPYGNTGTQARHILIADAIMSDEQARKEGWIYTRGMTLGHLPDALVTVEIK